MENGRKHWTEKSSADFVFRIGADFVNQIEAKLDEEELQQNYLAKKMEISDGAVSQKLNNPGNLQLQTIVSFARSVGMKVSMVLYNDDDHENKRGPIHPEIFNLCWERAGKPKDFFEVNRDRVQETAMSYDAMLRVKRHKKYKPLNRQTVHYTCYSETGENRAQGVRPHGGSSNSETKAFALQGL